ncbi:MAG TPA: DNA glycosylase [Verrucomicrobiae bacterium]|nr:DNA glycosylase [Verrucomicrobiae bacterium]
METFLPVRDYDLAATLDSGQVFRWQREGDAWTGVLGQHFLRLTQKADGIHAQAAAPVADWNFLREFLQSDINLAAILKTFPVDGPMQTAVNSCPGLRLLRQDPWECLASFILSSTKQIVQIRQIVVLLCERFGEPALGTKSACFPTPQRLAAATEAELRACKMGFRAPGLLGAARAIAEGKLDLECLRTLQYFQARNELMKLRGVGGKIADCVLLFAYGFDSAFPVDVWIERALQELYFPRRRASDKRLREFAATHFGPHAGYAQQYLFHYMRTKVK